MTEKLVKILKDPKYIKCWYPNSGDDFEVTKIWIENNGNAIIPNLFILTDSNLIQIQNENNCVTRLKNQGYELVEEFTISTRLNPIKEVDWAYKNILEEVLQSKTPLTNDKIRTIMNNEYFFNYLYPDQKGALAPNEILELHNMGLGLEYFDIENFENLPPNQKLNLINIIQDNPPHLKTISLYQNGDIQILLLNCKNNEFYDLCTENEVTFESAVIAVQNNDNNTDRFLYSEIKTIFTALKVKKFLLDPVNITQEQQELLNIKKIGQIIPHTRIGAPPLQLIFAEWNEFNS
jgi:hypothetical protein